jgi:hypothetical protein
MIRFLLALAFLVCIAAAVIAVLQTPPARPSDAETESSESEAVPLDVRRVGSSANTPNRTPAGRAPAPSVESAPAVFATVPSPVEPEAGRTRVLTDRAPVYSRNSEHGDVVTFLREGDEVELGVSVLDEDGLWVEVRLNQRTAGFVRRESLSIN